MFRSPNLTINLGNEFYHAYFHAVGNIPYDTTEDQLRNHCSGVGGRILQVKYVTHCLHTHTHTHTQNRPTITCYATFCTPNYWLAVLCEIAWQIRPGDLDSATTWNLGKLKKHWKFFTINFFAVGHWDFFATAKQRYFPCAIFVESISPRRVFF